MKTEKNKGEKNSASTILLVAVALGLNILVDSLVSLDTPAGALAHLVVGIITVGDLTYLGKRHRLDNGWATIAYALYVVSKILPSYHVPHILEAAVFVVAFICALVQIGVWADKPKHRQPN